jgi:putative exodeoxyribonuclease V, gamma subunit
MISTFYSNSFEVLRTVLATKIGFNLEDLRNRNASFFEQIKVIAPTTMVEDNLNRFLADHFGATPVIKFSNVASWMYDVLGKSLSNAETSQLMDWTFYEILRQKQTEKTFPTEEKRLYEYVQTLDPVGVLEFARHLNTVFITYGSYRFDWLQQWTLEKFKIDNPLPVPNAKAEEEQLKDNPDFLWQKRLWQELIKRTNNPGRDGKIFGWLENTIQRIQENKPVEGNLPIHLFLPFSIPPNLLPLIRAYEDSPAELNLYILNPCAEYWFESVPKAQFDWSENFKVDNSCLNYLLTNAASTRAAIDRLDSFLFSEEEASAIETDISDDDKQKRQDASVKHPGSRTFVSSEKTFENPEKEIKNKVNAETSSAYLEYPSKSFLHSFQNSILRMDSTLLPTEPDEKDVSLRILKAPSFVREVEAAIDILQNWFTDKKRCLKPSDVLVIVPDIERAAPIIEGVMASLPKDLFIPWKIIGLSEEKQNSLADAFVGLGKLLMSDFSAREFFAWLEKLPVQQQWGLSLDDISVIQTWLYSAGYSVGIDHEQLAALNFTDEDSSLQDAMERLSLGLFLDEASPLPFKNVLPIRGDEEAGFDVVSDGSGRLLQALSQLYLNLADQRRELLATNFALPADAWREALLDMKNRFFGNGCDPEESYKFTQIIETVCTGMTAAYGSTEKPVSFEVVLSELRSELSKTKRDIPSTGTMTFTSISLARGIPYKVICCLGFDEKSGFPGTPKFEEFDLTKDHRRRGDRDARKDNNAVFLDTLLSARENLLISYTIGTKPQSENNPSLVIDNFKNYFLSHAMRVGMEDGTAQERADELWKSIVTKVPLNRFSVRNFLEEPKSLDKRENNLFWKSPRKDVLNSIEHAFKNPGEREPMFANTGIPDKKLPKTMQHPELRELQVNFLLKFLTSYGEWAASLLKLESSELQAEERMIVPAKDDKLMHSNVKRKFISLLENNFTNEEALDLLDLNPKYGIESVRRAVLSFETSEVAEAYSAKTKFMETEALEGLSVALDYRVPTSVSNFVHRLSDKTDLFLWKKEDKTVRVKLGVFCSASEQKRELLRQIIWTEAGKPYDLLIFNESSDTDHFVTSSSTLIQNYGSEPLKAFLKLFECHCKNALGMKASEDALLWQGISEESIRRAADLSKTLEKDLGDYFNLLKEKEEKEEKKDLKGKGKKKDSKREDKKKKIHFPTAIDELTNFILQLKP